MVTASKARVGGGMYCAAAGTTLPTSANGTLGTGFTSLGNISDAGVQRSVNKNPVIVKAWGGATVAVLSGQKTETFKMKFIDIDNLQVLGLTFGTASGSVSSGITVRSEREIGTAKAFVINDVLAGGVLHRICIPSAVVTEIAEITYVDNEAVGYELTLEAMEDANGCTCYEYMVTGSTGSTS